MYTIGPFQNAEATGLNLTYPNIISPGGDGTTLDPPPNTVLIQPINVINTLHSISPYPHCNQPLLSHTSVPIIHLPNTEIPAYREFTAFCMHVYSLMLPQTPSRSLLLQVLQAAPSAELVL
jgi:hypothetical protein